MGGGWRGRVLVVPPTTRAGPRGSVGGGGQGRKEPAGEGRPRERALGCEVGGTLRLFTSHTAPRVSPESPAGPLAGQGHGGLPASGVTARPRPWGREVSPLYAISLLPRAEPPRPLRLMSDRASQGINRPLKVPRRERASPGSEPGCRGPAGGRWKARALGGGRPRPGPPGACFYFSFSHLSAPAAAAIW